VYDRELLAPELLEKLGGNHLKSENARSPHESVQRQAPIKHYLMLWKLARQNQKECGAYTEWRTTRIKRTL